MKLTQEDAKDLGAAIRGRRDALGMSRATLSNLIGRDPATIQGYEAGGKKVKGIWLVISPSSTMLASLADALNTSAEALCASAGIEPDAEEFAAAAFAQSAEGVRTVNESLGISGLIGVTIHGEQADVAALLSLALERGLMDRLSFKPVHAA